MPNFYKNVNVGKSGYFLSNFLYFNVLLCSKDNTFKLLLIEHICQFIKINFNYHVIFVICVSIKLNNDPKFELPSLGCRIVFGLW